MIYLVPISASADDNDRVKQYCVKKTRKEVPNTADALSFLGTKLGTKSDEFLFFLSEDDIYSSGHLIFIGDVMVDVIKSMSYQVIQSINLVSCHT